ncbi:MAG: hypothetical protein QOJ59_576 [Thermomicrobiales bacterium]|jgi:hypothetical protein|nr:hypothetical protein [Thermomicrobiales bacterium]
MTLFGDTGRMFSPTIAVNPFAGRTDAVPRPERDQEQYVDVPPSRLATAQEQWDAADAALQEMRAGFDAKKQEREAEEAREREIRDAASREHTERQRAATLDQLKVRYLSAPGMTLSDWEQEDHDALLREQARRYAVGDGPEVVEPRSLVDRHDAMR